MTHTPGPWYNGTSGVGSKGLAICSGAEVIAEVIGTGYPIGKGVAPKDVANARLIAAAPDLLAACKACAAVLSEHEQYDDWNGSSEHDAANLCRAAIARAES